MKHKKILFALLGLFCSGEINAQLVPLDTAVHTGTLPNGFTYYIRQNNEPKNRVYLYLVNKVGSVLEDDDQQGIAHFMEHMNFNGTTHFPKNELVSYLQKSGVRFGADLNAYTSFDETVYQLPLPADDPSILQNGFQIMRDWAQNATLDTTEINKERGVILEEERLGRGASERMQRQYFPLLLNQSRYSERIPIGKVDILNNFPPSVIKRFHADWYRPDLQALVVVGDIHVAQTEALIKKLFSDLKTPASEKPRIKYSVELTGKNQFIRVTDKEMPIIDFQVMIKHKAEKLETEQEYVQSMKRQLFNQMIGERMAAMSQMSNLPILGAEIKIVPFIGGLDAFNMNIIFKQGKFKEGVQLVWELVEKVKRFGFTQAELDRAGHSYLNGMERGFREKEKTNSESYVNEYKRLFLEQEASPGIIWEYEFVKNHIGQITLDQMNGFSKEYIRDTDRDILILAPEKNKNDLPDSMTVSSWIIESDQKKLSAFSDELNAQSLLTKQPVSGKLVFKKRVPSLAITDIKLSNGVRIILKPTDFKNDEIRFKAFSPGGTSLYSNADYENAAHAEMIGGFGVRGFNPVQLNKLLNGKIFKVNPYIGDRYEGMDGSSTPKDLETALQLLYLQFTEPRKDTVLFINYMTSAKEIMATRYSDPSEVFDDTVNMVLGAYNYRRMPASVKRLEQIQLDKIYHIYRERFADASGFTFIFVGNFEVDSILPLLEKYLGSLPTLNRNEKARDLGIHIPAGIITKKVFKGFENKATVKMVFSGDYVYNAENNLTLNAIKEVLAIKIIQHLREDESEVYSPKVQINYNKNPKSRFAFTVNFGCAPANADHLMNAVVKEITSLKKNGPTAEDLDKFRAEYKRVRELQLRQNEFWLDYLVTQYENGEKDGNVLTSTEGLDKLTSASIRAAAQKWLSGRNEIRFELLPELSGHK